MAGPGRPRACGFACVAVEAYRLNIGPYALAWWAWAAYGLALLSYLGLVVLGILLLGGHAGALGWLTAVDAGLLSTAAISAWVLLSHAQGA